MKQNRRAQKEEVKSVGPPPPHNFGKTNIVGVVLKKDQIKRDLFASGALVEAAARALVL